MRPLVPLAGLLFTLVASCTKIKTTDMGADLLPQIDRVSTFDTLLPVVTDNLLLADSALPLIGKDYSGKASEHLLGSINTDPLFGRTAASIFLELKPPNFKYFFENVPDSLSLDSVVLCLRWNRTWGDTLATQTIDVFRVDEPIRRDTNYSTNAQFAYTQKLGSRTFAPHILDDSIPVGTYKVANQLRIRLSDAFGRNLLAQDSAEGRPFSSDSLFRNFLKGFAVVPQTTGTGAAANALMGMALSDTNTSLSIYYRCVRNGKTDTLSRKFPFDNTILCGSANRVVRDRKGSEMERYLGPATGAGDSLVYIQVTPGSYAQVAIPALTAFKAVKGNVLVHLAELVASEVPETPRAPFLTPPGLLYADFYDTTAKVRFPFGADGFPTGTYDPSFLGGLMRMAPAPGGSPYSTYGIYLTRHMQGVITRNLPNLPLTIYAPYLVSYSNLNLAFGVNRLAAGRVRLGGGNHSKRPMRLRLVYTKI
jgi:hypothetical protein